MEQALHHPDHEHVVAHLQRLRIAAGLTQRELAQRFGCAHNLIHRIEQGGRKVEVLELIWYCEALGADPLEVFGEIFRDIQAGRAERGAK